MLIFYIRSSSVQTYKWCPRKYYLTYSLGWTEGEVRKNTDLGTICHCILEIMAIFKLAKQNKQKTFINEIVGERPTTRIDINELIETVYNYYTTGPFKYQDWKEWDYIQAKNMIWNAVMYQNQEYSPLKRTIVQPEQQFDIEIKEDWAKYETTLPDGTKQINSLHLKGTIDLITKVGKNYEILDWKSGQPRKDWKNNKTKSIADLHEDFQLRLYHYVAHKLYPEISDIGITIYYIRNLGKKLRPNDVPGGPHTMFFDKSDLNKTEEMIKEYFLKIKDDKDALPIYNDSCTKYCNYSKTVVQTPTLLPIVADKDHQFTKCGEHLVACDMVGKLIEEKGMDYLDIHAKRPGFELDKYVQPGGEEKNKEVKSL